MPDLLLTEAEIAGVAADLSLPRCQLRELHRQGFWRARLGRNGKVILERAHYEAVCAGALPPSQQVRHTSQPQLEPVARRKAA